MMASVEGNQAATGRIEAPSTKTTITEPSLLGEVLTEADRLKQMRLAELRSFVRDMEEDLGAITEEEREALEAEWPA